MATDPQEGTAGNGRAPGAELSRNYYGNGPSSLIAAASIFIDLAAKALFLNSQFCQVGICRRYVETMLSKVPSLGYL